MLQIFFSERIYKDEDAGRSNMIPTYIFEIYFFSVKHFVIKFFFMGV